MPSTRGVVLKSFQDDDDDDDIMVPLMRGVHDAVKSEVERSTVFDSHHNNHRQMENQIPYFHPEEIILGKFVGRGGFCVVHEIHDMCLKRSTNATLLTTTNTAAAPDVAAAAAAAAAATSNSNSTSNSTSNSNSASNTNTKSVGAISWKNGMFGPRTKNSKHKYFRKSSSTDLEENSVSTNSDNDPRELLARRVLLSRRRRRRSIRKNVGKLVAKQVQSNLRHTKSDTYVQGMIDLALEIKFLTSLNHIHIISLLGICCSGNSSSGSKESTPSLPSLPKPQQPPQQQHLIIMEYLPELLTQRLNTWMHLDRMNKGITGLVTGGKKRVTGLLQERLLVAYDIAETMDYLHSKNIIYRDLKPDNIGFDSDGVLKLFDFGIARELRLEARLEDGLYKMTRMSGAMRYMAPEVGLGLPYNLKADVYSWSMIFWYMMTLEPPMGFYTPQMFIDQVFARGQRPYINGTWSPKIKLLFRYSWHHDIEQRHDFKTIMSELRGEISMISDSKIDGIGNDNVTEADSKDDAGQ